ncbi:CLUMA_CG010830, isoform A [Clunio marinus]|uniref:Galactosylgalactosylxylosylprotein 3-beta-glucuronosyltransferase n=1 Tax=Clunio marinus TaxID=568069 RepID=A0A1J1IG67_9DIPT|nr:CLUMA_CG010830, isoform A [Clunio marinus]
MTPDGARVDFLINSSLLPSAPSGVTLLKYVVEEKVAEYIKKQLSQTYLIPKSYSLSFIFYFHSQIQSVIRATNTSNVLGKLYLKVQEVSEKSQAKPIISSFEFCDRHTSNAGISHILTVLNAEKFLMHSLRRLQKMKVSTQPSQKFGMSFVFGFLIGFLWSLIYFFGDTSFFYATLVKKEVLPQVYVITPTYRRQDQLADLTGLGYTLKHVPNLLWLLIEDSDSLNPLVADLLKKINVPFVHLNGKCLTH